MIIIIIIVTIMLQYCNEIGFFSTLSGAASISLSTTVAAADSATVSVRPLLPFIVRPSPIVRVRTQRVSKNSQTKILNPDVTPTLCVPMRIVALYRRHRCKQQQQQQSPQQPPHKRSQKPHYGPFERLQYKAHRVFEQQQPQRKRRRRHPDGCVHRHGYERRRGQRDRGTAPQGRQKAATVRPVPEPGQVEGNHVRIFLFRLFLYFLAASRRPKTQRQEIFWKAKFDGGTNSKLSAALMPKT